MLTELCAELRNYFEVPNGRHFGKFEISGGRIAPLDFLQEGQYFRIVGSVFNDGVYKYRATSVPTRFVPKGSGSMLTVENEIFGVRPRIDEVFDGAVWAMRVPPAVIALSAKIKSYLDDPNNAPTGITSESVGGYSVSRATNNRGVVAGWRSVFADDLNRWRKL